MRRAFIIDARGTIHAVATPSFAAGLVHVVFARSGVEVAFHRYSVPWSAFAKALSLLSSSHSKRIVLRLLPESSAPIPIFFGVWDFARHAERLALMPASTVSEDALAKTGANAPVSHLSLL
jgi:hypothetical protein